MSDRVRLFVEIEGTLIPVVIKDKQKVYEGLGILEWSSSDGNGSGQNNSVGNDTGTIEPIPLKMFKTKAVYDFLMANLEKGHSTSSIAKQFTIDIGIGMSKKHGPQKSAYNKVFVSFTRARTRIAKNVGGRWVQRKDGFKNPITVWYFRKNEEGSGISRAGT